MLVKNFVETTLSCTVIEINTFYTEIQDGHQNGGKMTFGEVTSRLCRYPPAQKFCRNRSISYRFRDKCVFAYYTEIQDGRQHGGKTIFGTSRQ